MSQSAPADLPGGGSISPAYATMVYDFDGFGVVPILFAGSILSTQVNVQSVKINYRFHATLKVWVLYSCVRLYGTDIFGNSFCDKIVLFKYLPKTIQDLVRAGSPGYYSSQGEELS